MLKTYLPVVLILSLLAFCGCGDKADYDSATLQSDQTDRQGDGSAPAASGLQGTVLETMDAGGYTYVRVETADGEIWAAGPLTEVQAGQTVVMPGQMLMRSFHSKTLDRKFDEIWFVSAIQQPGQAAPAAASAGAAMGHAKVQTAASDSDVSGIEKAEGGMTVAEIYAAKGSLGGKPVVLRAKVVKFTPNIMGRNWIHVQDGSRHGDDYDLAVTSAAVVEAGDVVLIRGVVAEDKDFGAGYLYPMIIEGAEISVQ